MTCFITIIVATKSMSSYTSLKTCFSSLSKEGYILILHFVFMKILVVEADNMIDIGTRLIMAAGHKKIAR